MITKRIASDGANVAVYRGPDPKHATLGFVARPP